LFGVLLRKRLCKTDDTGFCRRIVALPHLAFLAVDRGDVDDPAEIAVTHAVNDGLYDVEHAVEIDPDDVAPLLIGHAMQHGVARNACVIDDHRYRAELSLNLFESRNASLVVANVPFENGDAGFSLKILCGFVITPIICGNAKSAVLEFN